MINGEWKWIKQNRVYQATEWNAMPIKQAEMKNGCDFLKKNCRTPNIQTMKASLPKPDLFSSPFSLYLYTPILAVLLFHEYPKVPLDLNDILLNVTKIKSIKYYVEYKGKLVFSTFSIQHFPNNHELLRLNIEGLRI